MKSRAWILLGVAACAPAAPPTAQTAPPPPSASFAVAPPPPAVDAGPPAPPKKSSQCKPVGPNQISDDDHPQIAGLGGPQAFEWLEKRGVTKKAAVAWYGQRLSLKSDEAEAQLTDIECQAKTLGDPAEDGIVCQWLTITELTQHRLTGIVVRNKQPITVFQVGLGVGAMDFPEAHHLDLAFALNADGKSFDVFDRAPDGTVLVAPPSRCLAREKDPNAPPMIEMGYPATLHDCEGAKKVMASMASSGRSDPRFHGVVASADAFVKRSCKDRGRWTWNKDKFTWNPQDQR